MGLPLFHTSFSGLPGMTTTHFENDGESVENSELIDEDDDVDDEDHDEHFDLDEPVSCLAYDGSFSRPGRGLPARGVGGRQAAQLA